MLKSNEPITVDLVGEISPEKLSKFKKSLFEFFLLISNSWVKKRLTKVRNFLAYCGIGIKQFQFQSLVLLSTTKKKSSYYDSLIENILNYIRFDLCFIRYSSQNSLNIFCLSIIFTLVFIFIVVFVQVYTKRRIFVRLLVVVFGALIWIIENYLMIPVVIYSTIYIKHSWLMSDPFVSVYDRSLVFEYHLGIFFIIQLGFLYSILLMNTIFNYTSAYSYETAYSRAHSVVSLKQMTFLFVLSMAHILVSKLYFLYISIITGIFMVYNYMYYMPYYSNFDNLVDSGLWTTLTISSSLSLVNELLPQGFETVICLAVILPFIYFILWTKLKENLNKRSNLEEESPYISELKIRRLCYMKKEISDEKVQEIRMLFNEYTKRFIEFKLLFIWECNFELKYSPNSALAMMKLLKSVFAEKRPEFLKKPKKVFRSFPDIESQFFYYKLYKKIYDSNSIKDFSLLKYLKNYSKSNKLDENACLSLIQLIDYNLESSRYSDKEISIKILEFSESIQIKDSTLSRYLKKYNDESDYLSQYKNFKEQLFNSNDPNSVSQQDKRRESFIDKLMGFNSEQKVAKLIISGSPKEVGKIIYLNRNCLDLLGANYSAEVLGKNFTFIIPPPYDKLHSDILQKFLLFGQKTDLKRNHLIITDIEGYSLEVSMHLSIAFHAQVPYFVLDLVPKSPKECIAFLDINGKILCFSEELNTIIKPEINFIQNLLPKIDEYFETYPSNQPFFYNECGKNELLKRVEIIISSSKFNILYFFEDECSFKFNHQLHNIPIKFSRQNSILIKSRKRESEMTRSKKSSFVKRKLRTNELISDQIRLRVADNTKKIERFTSFLLLANKIIFLSLAALILSFTISEMAISDNQKLCEIMNNVGILRFSLGGISKNTRSISLLKKGFITYYDYETYVSYIVNNSRNIESVLDEFKSSSDVFPILKKFKNHQVKIVRFINEEYYEETSNLYDSLIESSASASMLVNSGFTHVPSLYYIYNNCLNRIFNALNSSAYDSLVEMRLQSQSIFFDIQSIKVILFIPLFLLIIASAVILFILEEINKKQWNAISSISINSLVRVRSKALERMKNIHSKDEILDSFISRREKLYNRSYKTYILSTSILLIFILIYYISVLYSIENPLSSIIDTKLNHRFFGGLRRSLLDRSFIWARESYLESYNLSYTQQIKDYKSYSSARASFESESDLLIDIEKRIIGWMFELSSEGLDYKEYLQLMLNSVCGVLDIKDCEDYELSKGIHGSILSQVFDLWIAMQRTENVDVSIHEIEFKINLITEALKNANLNHEERSDKYYSSFKDSFIAACALSLLTLVGLYYFLQRPVIEALRSGLLSRNQLILMFQETQMKKTGNEASTSNAEQG